MASDRATREAAEVLGRIHFGSATVDADTEIVAHAIDAAEERGREQAVQAIEALPKTWGGGANRQIQAAYGAGLSDAAKAARGTR